MRRGHYLLLLLFVAASVGCSRPAHLTVINRSSSTLTYVVASGNGFSLQMGTLAPGGQRKFKVRPAGDSAVQLEFDADGRHYSSGPQGYFDRGSRSRITATIATDFTVTIESTPSGY